MLRNKLSIEPKIWNGGDCFQLAISNVLRFYGLKRYKSIWKQNGLTLKINNGLPMISASYMSLQDELRWIHNIEFISSDFKEENKLINFIEDSLNNQFPVIISVDTFNLQSNMFYETKNFHHCITLTGFDEDKYYYIDDAYNIKDNISKRGLIKAASLSSLNIPNNEFYRVYIVKRDNKKIELLNQVSFDVYTVISENLQSLKKSDKFMQSEYCGIYAMENLVEAMKELNPGLLSERDLMILYRSFTKTSNNNFLYSNFLKEFSGNDTRSLQETLMEISQEWKICANMAYKSRVKDRSTLYLRLMKKLFKIKDLYENELMSTKVELLARREQVFE